MSQRVTSVPDTLWSVVPDVKCCVNGHAVDTHHILYLELGRTRSIVFCLTHLKSPMFPYDLLTQHFY